MIKKYSAALFLVVFGFSISVQAGLLEGDEAPDFLLEAALGGEVYKFKLSESLKTGPVVLYFYPKAFTKGCTVEAHLFAESIDEFKKLNATVIGVSNDSIDVLQKFSVEACQSRFLVGADPKGEVIDAYKANMLPVGNTSKRISFVITPDRKVLYVYSALKPEQHITNTLEALRKWEKTSKD